MPSSRRFIAGAATAALIALSPAYASVKSGVDAWQDGNYAGAVAEWRPLAETGDPDAQFNMGQAYKLGRGVPPDLKLAQTWYEKAAQQGHEQAQANLGLILFQNGEREKAMPWISKASDNGDPRAQYVLATALFNDDAGIGKDWPRAYALMVRAAAQGLPQAATSVTQMDGLIPYADRQKGLELAKQIEQRDAAHAAAMQAAAPTPVRSAPSVASPPRVARNGPLAASPALTATTPLVPPPSKPRAGTPAKPPVVKSAPAKPSIAAFAAVGGRWRVQLGAYGSVDGARGQWATLSRKIGAFAGLKPSYEPVGTLTRLRVGPLADRAAADRVCSAAKAAGQACFPVAP